MTTTGNEYADMLAAAGLIEDAAPESAPAAAAEVDAEPAPASAEEPRVVVAEPAPLAVPARIRAHGPAAGYVEVLERKLRDAEGRFAGTLEAVYAGVPKDQIVRTSAVQFVPAATKGLLVQVGDDALTPTDWALGQIAERAGVPVTYLRGLAGSEVTWQRELAAHILGRHLAEDHGRNLLRSVRGSLRGWLSDRYRRLDSRPLLDALAAGAKAMGALPFDATTTETRVAVKIVHPEILEPIPGEHMLMGLEWSNSDFGNGTHSIRAFALRVACTNGATTENLLKEIHLGGRLEAHIELSDRTHRLDTARSVSALGDMVRAALGPKGVETLTERLRAAAEERMSRAQLAARIGKATTKAEAKAILDAFGSEDVINLPAGEHVWRGSNAISWIARNTEDPERRLDLERLAGALLKK